MADAKENAQPRVDLFPLLSKYAEGDPEPLSGYTIPGTEVRPFETAGGSYVRLADTGKGFDRLLAEVLRGNGGDDLETHASVKDPKVETYCMRIPDGLTVYVPVILDGDRRGMCRIRSVVFKKSRKGRPEGIDHYQGVAGPIPDPINSKPGQGAILVRLT